MIPFEDVELYEIVCYTPFHSDQSLQVKVYEIWNLSISVDRSEWHRSILQTDLHLVSQEHSGIGHCSSHHSPFQHLILKNATISKPTPSYGKKKIGPKPSWIILTCTDTWPLLHCKINLIALLDDNSIWGQYGRLMDLLYWPGKTSNIIQPNITSCTLEQSFNSTSWLSESHGIRAKCNSFPSEVVSFEKLTKSLVGWRATCCLAKRYNKKAGIGIR